MIVAIVALIVATVAIVPLVERSFSAALVGYRMDTLATVSAQVELDAREGTGPQPAVLENALDPRLRALTGDPIPTTAITATWIDQGALVQIQSTAGQCQQVRIVQGRCPSGPGEALISQEALAAQRTAGLRVGAKVAIVQSDSGTPDPMKTELTVVGSYVAQPTAFWGGVDPGLYVPPNPAHPAANQNWLVAADEFAASGPQWYAPYYRVRFPLDKGAVTDQTLPSAVAGAARTNATLPKGAVFTEPLTQLSNDAATDLAQVGQLVPLLFLQLLILVLILAYQVFAHLTAIRRTELAVLKMRGHDRSSLRRFGIGEFAPSFLVGLPTGLVAAYLVDLGICRFILPSNQWPYWSWWALILSVVALAVAAALALVVWSRTTRRPIIELMRTAAPRRRGVPTALVVAGALALAGVVLAATGNLTGAPALIVPTLAAIVLATVVAATLGPAGSAAVRGLFASARPTGALGVAQTVRRPGVTPVLTTLLIAATLLSFSTSLLVRGDANRQARATAELGAPAVVGVSSTVTGAVDPKALIAAIDAVDPRHRQLTPVVEISAASDEALATVGVIPAEVQRIAATDGIPQEIPWSLLDRPGTVTTPNAIASAEVAGRQVTAPSMTNQDGTFTITGTAAYIPGVPQQAVVVNLATMLAAGTRTDNVLEYVWSSTTDPAVLQRLTRELNNKGFDTINVHTISELRAAYEATATAWSMRVSVLLAAAAVLVALLSVATMIVATRRQRAIDLQSLQAAGVPDRTVRRATILEFLLVAVVATVLAVVAAPIGATVVGDALPWWSTPPEYPVTRTGFVWSAGLLAPAALLVVLAVLAVIVGRRSVRGAGGPR